MKFLKGFLIFIGILILILILFVGYLYFTDPFNLRIEPIITEDGVETEVREKYDHPLLNESQEDTLEKIGIDAQKIPSTITPEMEDCFVGILGQERVNEIIAGDSPSIIEIFKAKDCIN